MFSFSIELLNFRDLIVIDLLNAEAKKYDGNKSLFLIQNESAQYNLARAVAINVYNIVSLRFHANFIYFAQCAEDSVD